MQPGHYVHNPRSFDFSEPPTPWQIALYVVAASSAAGLLAGILYGVCKFYF